MYIMSGWPDGGRGVVQVVLLLFLDVRCMLHAASCHVNELCCENGKCIVYMNERYVPRSPILHDDNKTPPITPAPPSTPKNRGKGSTIIAPNNTATSFHAMTVSVTHATQRGATVVTTKPCTAPTCYTTTRSAAMMAVALGQRSKSPTYYGGSSRNGDNRGGKGSGDGRDAAANTNKCTSPSTVTKFATSASTQQKKQQHNSTIETSAQSLKKSTQINGSASGGSASSGSDNDGFNTSTSSATATALRRLYFKSGRKSKMNSMTSIPMSMISTATAAYHTSVSGGLPSVVSNPAAAVPKVIIMGSSTSMTDANINTSTDSASTLVTSVTHTDTSETCDSLDFGDNSGQSEPLFSSLEEPLLTAIQNDSEHDGTEMELTSCSIYNRPDLNLQDSAESQESSLSTLTGEPSSATPLLASYSRHNNTADGGFSATAAISQKERLPRTAPAPTSTTKHFTFDPPNSPKSARTSEKSRSHFSFKDQKQQQQHQQQLQHQLKQIRHDFDTDKNREELIRTTNFIEDRNMSATRRDNSPSKGKCRGGYAAQHGSSYYDYEHEEDVVNISRSGSKKSRARDTNSSFNSRNRYSTGGSAVIATTVKTSPKRENKRSPSSSKVNSAPPTTKDINFFGSTSALVNKPKQLSPSSPHTNATNQRKYSSSSSSGGSDHRDRNRTKDVTMFPFDREIIDYDRIQRECFAVEENSSSATGSSDSDEVEPCSVYERKMSSHHGSPKSSDIFQEYTLLSQHEQQQVHGGGGGSGGPPSRKNSKRIRPNSVIHTTIRENQQYIPQSDAFYPQPKTSSSPSEHSQYTQHSPKSYVELNKFDEIASKFDQIPPKYGSNTNLSHNKTSSPSGSCSNNNSLFGSTLQAGNKGGCNSNNNGGGGLTTSTNTSPTGSTRGTTPPPLPNLRVDFFTESQMHPRKKSFKTKPPAAVAAAAAVASVGMTCATHDNLDESQKHHRSQLNVTSVTNAGAGPINVTSNPLEAAVCTQPRATIVVQQPSLSLDNTVETLLIKSEGDFVSVEQGKDSVNNTMTSASLARKRNSQQLQHPPHHPQHSQHHQHQQQQHQQQQQQQQQQQKRDENMRQLLDVTNSLTSEELRDFEKRYGSPHHSRSQSVKTPGSRASGRPNQLCLPQQRSRVASMPNTGVEEEYYRLRHFSITGKGVVNRGDSLKSRRSRSNNSVASSNSSTEHLTATQVPAPNSARTSATCSLASSRESSTSNPGNGPYRVLMLGGPAVGKSSLVSQFMTSEYLHAYDTSIDDESGEKAVSVLLSGEESELIFIDHGYAEMNPDDCLTSYDPHGYCVIYSAADRASFNLAEHVLQVLWTNQNIAQKAVILVANKADLARSRLVTTEEGKATATAYDCKFIETSVGINHNVDELLVGLLSQIRLKLENPEKSRDLFRKRSIRKSKRRACSPLSGTCLTGGTNPNSPLSGPTNNVVPDVSTPPGSAHSSPRKYRGSRTSTSLKVKGLLGRVWARDSKSKSCENLHVL